MFCTQWVEGCADPSGNVSAAPPNDAHDTREDTVTDFPLLLLVVVTIAVASRPLAASPLTITWPLTIDTASEPCAKLAVGGPLFTIAL